MDYALKGWKGWMVSIVGYLEAFLILMMVVPSLSAGDQGSASMPLPLPSMSSGQAGNLESGFQIQVPEGTGGMTPELSVVYRGGPGGLLANWDLDGLGMILMDSTGNYQAIPGGLLLEASDGSYRTQMDSGNVYELSNNTWSVHTLGGMTFTYGSDAGSRLNDSGDATYTWALNRVEDLKGNFYTVSYGAAGNRLYPAKITYGKNTSLTGLKERTISFAYSTSSDGNVRIRYSHGMLQTMDRKITRVDVEYNNSNIYSYHFAYDTEGKSGLDRLTGYSRTINSQSYESSVSLTYTSLSPSYSHSSIAKNPGVGSPDVGACKNMADACQLAASDYTPPQIKTPALYLCGLYELQGVRARCETGNTLGYGDFNGDGYQDVIGAIDESTGSGRIITNIKDGGLQNYNQDSSEAAYTKGTAFYMDMNGDGLDDYVRFNSDHFVVSYAIKNGGGNSYFNNETSYNIPTNGKGLGYDDEQSLLEKLLELWIDYQLQKLEAKKTRSISNLTSAMSGIGFVTGGIMGYAAGNVLGSVVGQSLYGDMGRGISNQLQLGQQVLGMQGDSSKDAFAQFADMNGDGLQDYIRLTAAGTGTGKISTAFNTGSSFSTDVLSSGINTGIPVTTTVEASANIDLTGLWDVDDDDDDVDEDDFYALSDEEQAEFLKQGSSSTASSTGFRALGDVNGDGIPDFIALVDDGGSFRLAMHYGNSDGSFSSPVLSSTVQPGSEKFRFFTDLNGDGYSDFIRSSGSTILISYGTGSDFGYTHISSVGESMDTGKSLGDVNGDGTPDFIRFAKDSAGRWHAMARIFKGKGFDGEEVDLQFYHPDSYSEENRLVFYGDVNGDGLTDVIAPSYNQTSTDLYVSAKGSAFSLSGASNGYTQIGVTYKSGLESATPSANTRSGGVGGYSTLTNTSPRLVVDTITVSDQNGTGKSRVVYDYSGDMIKIGPSREETRSLGPASRTEKGYYYSGGTWVQSPTYTMVEYYQGEDSTTGYKTAGMEKVRRVYRTSNGALLSDSTPTYSLRSSNPSMKNGKSVYLVLASKSVSRDLSTTVTIEKKQAVLSYNSSGQPTCTVDYGDTAVSGDDRTTVIAYTGVTSSNFASLPSTVTVLYGSSCSGSTVVSYQAMTYDGAGNVTEMAKGPDSSHTRSTTTTYDGAGNPLAMTSYGLTTTTAYDTDTASFPVSVTSPLGFVSTRSYDSSRGLLLSETNPDGRTIEHTYDALGRETGTVLKTSSISSYSLGSASYSMASSGEMTVTRTRTVAGGGSQTSTTVTDIWGRNVSSSISSPQGTIYTSKTYDDQDRVVSETLPYFFGGSPASTSYTYDDLGRVLTMVQPKPNGTGSLTITRTPDTLYTVKFKAGGSGPELLGYAQKETTASGQELYIYKTADGRKIQEIYTTAYLNDEEAATDGYARIRHHYDAKGRLEEVTRTQDTSMGNLEDDSLMTISYTYDGYGRLTSTVDPDKGTTTTTYTDFDQTECVTREKKDVICKTYDAYHRVEKIRRSSTEGTPLVMYTYDDEGTYGKKGAVRTIHDDTGKRDFTYSDVNGQVTKIDRGYKFGDYDKNFDVEIAYDNTGAVTSRTFPATNVSLGYSYDSAGRLTTVSLKDPDGHMLTGGSTIDVYKVTGFNEFGSPTQIEYGNGVITKNTYNSAGRRSRIQVFTGSEGNTSSADYTFTWTDDGMLAAKTDNLTTATKNYTESFVYDGAHRLVEATGPYERDSADHQTTLNYYYGSDGQPLIVKNQTAIYDTDSYHRMKELANVKYDYDLEGRGTDPELGDTTEAEEDDTDGSEFTVDSTVVESSAKTYEGNVSLSTRQYGSRGKGHHYGQLHKWIDSCYNYRGHHGNYHSWGKHRRDCYRSPKEEGVGNVIYRFNTNR